MVYLWGSFDSRMFGFEDRLFYKVSCVLECLEFLNFLEVVERLRRLLFRKVFVVGDCRVSTNLVEVGKIRG